MKFIVLLLLALASATSHAMWVTVTRNEVATVYIDSMSIQKWLQPPRVGGVRPECARRHGSAIGQVEHRLRLHRRQIQNPQRQQPSQQNGQRPRHQSPARARRLASCEPRQHEPTVVFVCLCLVSLKRPTKSPAVITTAGLLFWARGLINPQRVWSKFQMQARFCLRAPPRRHHRR